jgi:hypothetical protein
MRWVTALIIKDLKVRSIAWLPIRNVSLMCLVRTPFRLMQVSCGSEQHGATGVETHPCATLWRLHTVCSPLIQIPLHRRL